MDTILSPLYDAVSWIIVQFHSLYSLVFDEDSGWAWGLSIVSLVVADPDLPDPALREADQVDPEHAGAPAEDEGDPGALQERQAAPVRRDDEAVQGDGHQPALLVPSDPGAVAVLLRAVPRAQPHRQGQAGRRASTRPWSTARGRPTSSAPRSPRSSLTAPTRSPQLGASLTDVRVVTVIMIVLMSASQFYTQRQLMTKNVDMTVKTPFMQQQKMLMYVFPIMFAVFGINFPVGVLVYWLTTNVWTMGQQMFVIQRNPTPGCLAFKQRQERLRAEGKLKEEPARRSTRKEAARRRAPAAAAEAAAQGQAAAGGGAVDAGASRRSPEARPRRRPTRGRAAAGRQSGKKPAAAGRGQASGRPLGASATAGQEVRRSASGRSVPSTRPRSSRRSPCRDGHAPPPRRRGATP